MKLFTRLLALFLIMPVVELALLVQVEKVIDFWPTVGLIVLTGVFGSYFAKREGLAVWRKFNERLGAGALPGKEVVDGIIILCAGALLITPGVITDVIGILGLLPPSRALIRRQVMKRAERSIRERTMRVGFDVFSADVYGPTAPKNGPSGQSGWAGTPRDVPGYADRDPGQGEQRRPGNERG